MFLFGSFVCVASIVTHQFETFQCSSVAAKASLECCWRYHLATKTFALRNDNVSYTMDDIVLLIWQRLLENDLPHQYTFINVLSCIKHLFQSKTKVNNMLLRLIADYKHYYVYFDKEYQDNMSNYDECCAKIMRRTCWFYTDIMNICEKLQLDEPILALLQSVLQPNDENSILIPKYFYPKLYEYDIILAKTSIKHNQQKQTQQQKQTPQQEQQNKQGQHHNDTKQQTHTLVKDKNNENKSNMEDKKDSSLFDRYANLPMIILERCIQIYKSQTKKADFSVNNDNCQSITKYSKEINIFNVFELIDIVKQCHRQCQSLSINTSNFEENTKFKGNKENKHKEKQYGKIDKLWEDHIYNNQVLPSFLQIIYQFFLKQLLLFRDKQTQNNNNNNNNQQKVQTAINGDDNDETHEIKDQIMIKLEQLLSLNKVVSDDDSIGPVENDKIIDNKPNRSESGLENVDIGKILNEYMLQITGIASYINLQQNCQSVLINFYLTSIYYVFQELKLQIENIQNKKDGYNYNTVNFDDSEFTRNGNIVLHRTLANSLKKNYRGSEKLLSVESRLDRNLNNVNVNIWTLNLYSCEEIGISKNEIPYLCYIPMIFDTLCAIYFDYVRYEQYKKSISNNNKNNLTNSSSNNMENIENLNSLLIIMHDNRLIHFTKLINYFENEINEMQETETMNVKLEYTVNKHSNNSGDDSIISVELDPYSLQVWIDHISNMSCNDNDYFEKKMVQIVSLLLFNRSMDLSTMAKVSETTQEEDEKLLSGFESKKDSNTTKSVKDSKTFQDLKQSIEKMKKRSQSKLFSLD